MTMACPAAWRSARYGSATHSRAGSSTTRWRLAQRSSRSRSRCSNSNGCSRRGAAIGLTNQRETTILWDRATGEPLHRALVWQDRRTAGRCDELRAAGHEAWLAERTGLLLDAYFSATKLAWLLDQVPGARARAEAGELAFGTVDACALERTAAGI